MTAPEPGPDVTRLVHPEPWDEEPELQPSAWEIAAKVIFALLCFVLVSWGLVAWLG